METTATTPVVRKDRRVARRRMRMGFGVPGLMLCGLGLLLLGAWGGIVPYVGPKFGYGPMGAHAWQWSNANTVLNLIPGVAAVIGGLLVMAGGTRWVSRGLALFGAALAIGAGAWFVLGTLVYPVFFGTAPAWGGAAGTGAVSRFVTRLGYGMGVGLSLCMLGGMALAMLPARRRLVADEAVAEDVVAHRAAAAEPAYRRVPLV